MAEFNDPEDPKKDSANAEENSSEDNAARAPGLAAGRHRWPRRRRRHYGRAEALWGRSLYRFILGILRSGADGRRRQGKHEEAARLDDLASFVRAAKDVRKQRLAREINADEQHARMVVFWQKVDWRIEGQVLGFIRDVVAPELELARSGPEEDEGESRRRKKWGRDEEEAAGEKPARAHALRGLRFRREEARKTWSKSQLQSFAKTGACFDLSLDEWIAKEGIVIVEESSSTGSRASSRDSED